jgi:shikimate kinase
MNERTNIVLIGMPGCGKSTLGKRLAKLRRMSYIDTDSLLENVENMHIQDIVNRRGVRYLRQLESDLLSTLNLENTVIATGGSAVYSDSAMRHLGTDGVMVYLQISLMTLVKRVNNVSSRGLAKMNSHPLPRLYADRADLYQASADIIMSNDRPISALSMSDLNLQIDDFFDV